MGHTCNLRIAQVKQKTWKLETSQRYIVKLGGRERERVRPVFHWCFLFHSGLHFEGIQQAVSFQVSYSLIYLCPATELHWVFSNEVLLFSYCRQPKTGDKSLHLRVPGNALTKTWQEIKHSEDWGLPFNATVLICQSNIPNSTKLS